MNRIFFYPGNDRYVLFTEPALSHMYSHTQRRLWNKEAGGELFSFDPNSCGLIISTANGPNKTDFRNRHAWNPDINALFKDRHTEFEQNKHAVGLWHTHPEKSPTPSRLDRETTYEYLSSFQGERLYYLMVIIGNQGSIPAMAVWSANSEKRGNWIQLNEEIYHSDLDRLRIASDFE